MIIFTLYCAVTLILGLLARILYLIVVDRGRITKNASKTVETLIILGSGGHTTEMLRIVKHLDFSKYTPRVYIHAHTDKMSPVKLAEIEENRKDSKVLAIFRSREVGQSYLSSIGTTLIAFFHAINLLLSQHPDLILCNGPGTCVPLCIEMEEKIAPLTGDISWGIVIKNCQDQVPNEIRVHVVPICRTLEVAIKSNEKLPLEWVKRTLLRLEACIDRTWEALNTGHWKDVEIRHRYCYTICSALKCVVLEISLKNDEDSSETDVTRKMIEQVDKGLLLGAPLDDIPQLLTRIASRLNERMCTNTCSDCSILQCDTTNLPKELLPRLKWVQRYKLPSMETFYRDIFVKKVPAVLEGCIDHWRALKLWKDPNYLIKMAGTRTVPIEIGSKYTEEDWCQHLITLSDFIKSHVTKNNDKVGYLAQHQLFEQIPELKEDFSIPDYCSFSDNSEESIPDINAWFGPKGTVSPLHYDPKNNLLCQIFGCKQVILYHPNDSNNLYPYDTRLLCNTAQVDPINPDYIKFPCFKNTQGLMCYLNEGEMLFIPPGWWHHVVSLTPCFSVSFWW